MDPAAARLGIFGERVAERWLVARGWQVLDRRYRVGHRDIDLIVEMGATVAFVEVKTRRSEQFGGPVGAVGVAKRRHISNAATIWIDRQGNDPGIEYRFDVVGVLVSRSGTTVTHVPNAFLAWVGRR